MFLKPSVSPVSGRQGQEKGEQGRNPTVEMVRESQTTLRLRKPKGRGRRSHTDGQTDEVISGEVQLTVRQNDAGYLS